MVNGKKRIRIGVFVQLECVMCGKFGSGDCFLKLDWMRKDEMCNAVQVSDTTNDERNY